jgi:hypothetical protein
LGVPGRRRGLGAITGAFRCYSGCQLDSLPKPYQEILIALRFDNTLIVRVSGCWRFAFRKQPSKPNQERGYRKTAPDNLM